MVFNKPSHFLIFPQVLRRFVLHSGLCAFVVEHDLLMASYLADRVVRFEGDPPGVRARASGPSRTVREGMDGFLAGLGVTFRRDHDNGR